MLFSFVGKGPGEGQTKIQPTATIWLLPRPTLPQLQGGMWTRHFHSTSLRHKRGSGQRVHSHSPIFALTHESQWPGRSDSHWSWCSWQTGRCYWSRRSERTSNFLCLFRRTLQKDKQPWKNVNRYLKNFLMQSECIKNREWLAMNWGGGEKQNQESTFLNRK